MSKSHICCIFHIEELLWENRTWKIRKWTVLNVKIGREEGVVQLSQIQYQKLVRNVF